MRALPLPLLLVWSCLACSSLALAEGMTDKHLLDAPMIQQQQQPVLNQQNQLQRDSSDAALKARGDALIRACWSQVRDKAGASLHFQSATISEDNRVLVHGTASQAGNPGHTYRYSCRASKDKQHFDRIEFDQ